MKAAEIALAQEKADVEREKDQARKRTAEDQEFLKQVVEDRKQVAASIDAKLLANYERIRQSTRALRSPTAH